MKILLDEKQNKYKANLHCHSTVSDGRLTPEEIKIAYKEKGYSVVAYTDHDVMIAHDELNDENFLALHGYEIEIMEDIGEPEISTTHLCLIPKDPDNLKQVCFHREKYLYSNTPLYKDKVQFDENKPDFERKYCPECVNEIIKEGREHGFFVTYNHPNWSGENAEIYNKYTGMHAMEICNYSCFHDGFDDYFPQCYDDLLRKGEKIYCLSTDDNHNVYDLNSKRCDSFGGFTVFFADKLEYRAITDALFNGKFYASQGPEIYSLIYDEGKIKIKCSPAERIVFSTYLRHRECIFAEDGNGVCEAAFNVNDRDIYVRITVIDKFGKHANTNAYFVEDLKRD